MDNIENLKAEQILREIEPWVNKEVSYFDALVYYSEKYGIEIELIGEIIKRSPVLKAKVQEDAEQLNMVEKVRRLPI